MFTNVLQCIHDQNMNYVWNNMLDGIATGDCYLFRVGVRLQITTSNGGIWLVENKKPW